VVETVIFKEAVDFGIAKVSDSEVDEVFKSTRAKIMEKANVKSHWINLEISDAMLKEKIQRKLRAGKLLKYKTDTDQHEATEEEVKDYFEKNRQRFGSASLDSFKVTIKKFLTKKTADDRLREWFDVLKKKYKVKSL
jgi:predicted sugar kinase